MPRTRTDLVEPEHRRGDTPKERKKAPAGSVRAGLETVLLTEEGANALYFVQAGSDDFSDRRKVALEARNAVRQIVEEALSAPLQRAVAALRNHRKEVALRAARTEADAAAAKLRELEESTSFEPEAPAQPASNAGEATVTAP
jgi:hypothetical protein